MNFFKK